MTRRLQPWQHRRYHAIEAEHAEDCIAQLPAGLGAKVGLRFKVGSEAASLREVLSDGCIKEEVVVVARPVLARAADR
eukprot:3740254-Pleurochrysis_carterae.AAC.3